MQFLAVRGINRTIQLLLLFLFLFNAAATFYMPILAVFITASIANARLSTVGIALAIYAIVKSVFQLPLAKWLDRRPGEKSDFLMLLTGSVLATLYAFGYLFISTVPHLYVLQIMSGIADACIFAAYYAIFSHHIDKESQGFEWSLFSVGGLTVSAAIGALIGGFVAENFGFRVLFISVGIIDAIATLLLILLYPLLKILRAQYHYKTISHKRESPK